MEKIRKNRVKNVEIPFWVSRVRIKILPDRWIFFAKLQKGRKIVKSAKCTGDKGEHESRSLSNRNENCYNFNKNGKNEGPKMPILESRM